MIIGYLEPEGSGAQAALEKRLRKKVSVPGGLQLLRAMRQLSSCGHGSTWRVRGT